MSSKIGLGTVQFGLDYGINQSKKVSFESIQEIINFARSKNINTLDTASSYGDSEAVLGKVMVSDFNIITKTRHFNCVEIGDKEIDLFVNDFITSKNKLKVEYIYSLMIHNADDLLKPGANKLAQAIENLKNNGSIKKFGVSIYDEDQLQRILDNFSIDLVQLPFNIFDNRLLKSGMLRRLHEQNIEVHARSIFLQGLLLMPSKLRPAKFNRWNDLWTAWDEWLSKNNISALEASVMYVHSFKEIDKIIVGVENLLQLQQIHRATKGNLPEFPSNLFIDDVRLLNPSTWENL